MSEGEERYESRAWSEIGASLARTNSKRGEEPV